MGSPALCNEVVELPVWLGQPDSVQSDYSFTLTAIKLLLFRTACVIWFLMFSCVQMPISEISPVCSLFPPPSGIANAMTVCHWSCTTLAHSPFFVNFSLLAALSFKEPLLTATTEHHSQPSHSVACVETTKLLQQNLTAASVSCTA